MKPSCAACPVPGQVITSRVTFWAPTLGRGDGPIERFDRWVRIEILSCAVPGKVDVGVTVAKEGGSVSDADASRWRVPGLIARASDTETDVDAWQRLMLEALAGSMGAQATSGPTRAEVLAQLQPIGEEKC